MKSELEEKVKELIKLLDEREEVIIEEDKERLDSDIYYLKDEIKKELS